VCLVAALLPAACVDDAVFTDDDRVVGSGTIETETRDVEGFDEIAILTSGEVTVDVTGTQSLSVTTDDNILPLVTTESRDGTLTVGSRENTSYSPTDEVAYAVTATTFSGVTIRGSANVTVTGIDTDTFSVTVAGSGNVDLAGSADSLDISIPGSGRIDAEDLTVRSADISINGSGSAAVNTSDELDVTINGSGSVTYLGSPTNVSQSINGSGSVAPAPS
jgi:hypothetical protein